MRFCQGHQLGRTRRILAETQAGIEKAAKPKRSHKKRLKLEPWQEAAGARWADRFCTKAGAQ